MFRFADAGAMLERVVAILFNGFKDGETAAAEHLEIDAKFACDAFC